MAKLNGRVSAWMDRLARIRRSLRSQEMSSQDPIEHPHDEESSSTLRRPLSVFFRKQRLLIIGVICLVFAGVGLASVAGWAAANKLVVAEQELPKTEIKVISLPDYSQDVSARMPDVRGLTENDARQALVDAGIPAEFVSLTERDAAGKAGLIIQQTPVFGALNPNAVTLIVSTEASIPEMAGQPAEGIIGALQSLGARVEQVRIYEPGTTVGNVVRTEPEMGSAVPDVVKVYIADSPLTKSFDDFDRITGGDRTNSDVLHQGIKYKSALTLDAGRSDSVEKSAWDLKGVVTLLEGSYALDEESEGGVILRVRGDGVLIDEATVTSTEPVPFEWKLLGVKTLMFEIQRTDKGKSGRLHLLDPLLKGSYADLGSETP